MANKTEFEALNEAQAASSIQHIEGIKTPVVALPEGYRVHDLEYLQVQPNRIEQTVTVTTPRGFIDYVRRFAAPGATVFADLDCARFMAILDYHRDADTPEWGGHGVDYKCPLSKQWQAWTDVDGRWLSQEDFALFLEERCGDVTDPNGAELLEKALKFKLIKKAEFGSGRNLSTGEFSLTYSEENQKGTVEMPSMITATVPVYRGDAAYNVKVRLRYRVREGQLSLRFDMVEPDVIADDAFETVRKNFADQLEGVAMIIDGKVTK